MEHTYINNIYLENLDYQLKANKGFRDWALKRLLLVRSKSKNQNEINICNLLLNYIYDLNFKDIIAENSKRGQKV